ncbi:MAG: nucleotide sugar dehydrogenase [Candidatus Bathyarchaeia archaeon]
MNSQGPKVDLTKRIETRDLTVVIAGLGWMGLSLATLYAEAGCRVIGVDIDPSVVESVNNGTPLIAEPGLDVKLRSVVRSGMLTASTNLYESVLKGDAVFIAVPTLIDEGKKADYKALRAASLEVGKALKPEVCVLVQSTCAPGVTEKLVKKTLEKQSNLTAGLDFYLAYSPIRAMIGRALKDIQTYPKVVGGVDERSLEIASLITSIVSKGGVVKVKDVKTAEAAKIFETIYRDVNIALANEFAILCEAMDIDYVEAMKAANTQPYSHLHMPGIGVGGHCLPLYPYLLLTEALEAGVKLKLVKHARRINEKMPIHTLNLVIDALRACGKPLARRRVAVLGIAYRANVKEARYSPAVELIKLINKRGGRTTVYDPMYTPQELRQMGLEAKPNLKLALEGADCAVITIAHEEFKNINPSDFALHMRMPAAVVDGAFVLDAATLEKAGLVYRGVGRGVWTR